MEFAVLKKAIFTISSELTGNKLNCQHYIEFK